MNPVADSGDEDHNTLLYISGREQTETMHARVPRMMSVFGFAAVRPLHKSFRGVVICAAQRLVGGLFGGVGVVQTSL